jgi:hypothetical protein
MINRAQTSTRFHDYLDQVDEIYNNDLNWKGKWKSKDGSLIVKTSTDVMLDDAFDVLIIKAN